MDLVSFFFPHYTSVPSAKMRSLSILALALATGITAVAVSDDGSIVPGTAQVKYCEDKDYALSFDKIDMEPDPAIR